MDNSKDIFKDLDFEEEEEDKEHEKYREVKKTCEKEMLKFKFSFHCIRNTFFCIILSYI